MANNQKFINSQFSNMYLIDILTSCLQEENCFKNSMTTTRIAVDDR
ncbi:hypothetical protein [Lactobacillus panisapium]|nr:hypothetical protein [Lactobacillus panisapium]